MNRKSLHLHCAKCGEINMHQSSVKVYARDWEGNITHKDMAGNPSPRRDGISISIWCEHCDECSELSIIQHKGNTYITNAEHFEEDSF